MLPYFLLQPSTPKDLPIEVTFINFKVDYFSALYQLITTMKSLLYIALVSYCVTFAAAKSKYGDYYLGFGVDFVEVDDLASYDGEGLSLFANSLASDEADLHFTFDYARLDGNISKETVWSLGADYIYHLDNFSGVDGMFRPYVGGGIGYVDDSAALSLADDGFTWNLQAGTEILFTEEISLALGAKFFGLWSDFAETEFDLGVDLVWWINDIHGLSLGYSHSVDREVDVIGLKYLYSWR